MSEKLETKTSKEIAIYLHDAVGFAVPPFIKKEETVERIRELENKKWISVDALKQWIKNNAKKMGTCHRNPKQFEYIDLKCEECDFYEVQLILYDGNKLLGLLDGAEK